MTSAPASMRTSHFDLPVSHESSTRSGCCCMVIASGWGYSAHSNAIAVNFESREHLVERATGFVPPLARRREVSGLRYAFADALAPLKKASSSSLILSFRVEHMPCGAPGMTFRTAPFTTFDESIAALPIGTI